VTLVGPHGLELSGAHIWLTPHLNLTRKVITGSGPPLDSNLMGKMVDSMSTGPQVAAHFHPLAFTTALKIVRAILPFAAEAEDLVDLGSGQGALSLAAICLMPQIKRVTALDLNLNLLEAH